MGSRIFTNRLNALIKAGGSHLVHKGRLIGLEKESLRVNRDGALSHTSHPQELGSALTHPFITTDYSEALLEFVVPPMRDVDSALHFLHDIHSVVYMCLQAGEKLWSASMPCIVRTEADIPLAYYGTSNMGKMKAIYRRGLGYRYGRAMQTIAGVHFNYSFGDELWEFLYASEAGAGESLQDFRSRRYMDLLRNLLRIGWMVPYLFGASPAVCRNFIGTTVSDLEEWDEVTLYGRYATSLRMGDIGYQNNQEANIGVKASYNSLSEYIASLKYAVTTETEKYKQIGVNVSGEYRQLSACILQIENEYYSTVRPKPIVQKNKMPLVTLDRNGISYIELRSLDVGIFDPIGVSAEQLYCLEALMLFCLLADSPSIENKHWKEIDNNELIVAHKGRTPQLKLVRNGAEYPLKQWGLEVCNEMVAICELLDSATSKSAYRDALKQQVRKLEDPAHCPSAQVLAAMQETSADFVAFAERQAKQNQVHFSTQTLPPEKKDYFNDIAKQSLKEQADIETADEMALDEYINAYFAQIR